MRLRDLTGKKYGQLTTLGVDKIVKGHKYYLCRCDCGSVKSISGSHLVTGATQSCGCLKSHRTTERNTTHGKSNTRLFSIWQGMKKRCNNSNNQAYKYYGARGIHVCGEWINDFSKFYNWSISNGYSDNLTLERIDVNGNYEPKNCKWIPFEDQARNRRDTTHITINGETKRMSEWAKESPVTTTTIYQRIKDGWTIEDAILTPPHKKER